MEKVILTQEQADAIEYLISHNIYSEKELIRAHAKHPEGWENEAKPLKNMDLLLLVDALRIGYEVEPEFKLNDYIFHEENKTIVKLDTEERVEIVNKAYLQKEKLRHATPSEIAEEKERRMWASIGRKLGEYHEYDIAYDEIHDCYVEVGDPHAYAGGNLRVANLDDKSDSREINPANLQIVCTAESRLDVKTNE